MMVPTPQLLLMESIWMLEQPIRTWKSQAARCAGRLAAARLIQLLENWEMDGISYLLIVTPLPLTGGLRA